MNSFLFRKMTRQNGFHWPPTGYRVIRRSDGKTLGWIGFDTNFRFWSAYPISGFPVAHKLTRQQGAEWLNERVSRKEEKHA